MHPRIDTDQSSIVAVVAPHLLRGTSLTRLPGLFYGQSVDPRQDHREALPPRRKGLGRRSRPVKTKLFHASSLIRANRGSVPRAISRLLAPPPSGGILGFRAPDSHRHFLFLLRSRRFPPGAALSSAPLRIALPRLGSDLKRGLRPLFWRMSPSTKTSRVLPLFNSPGLIARNQIFISFSGISFESHR